ncbi:hypothetical protein HU200_021454 [Digitaria exilis]|uniref:Uncharacterized protein n=1 Tax=Digitaria exilis TaxID=1010633 RepID=A0A835EZ50_9POAL|nr:hypothetical protein HU200_021454 [Digitaria exilis]CAB3467544.1 unnamed protein product [Digitaria exilis]
MLLLRRHLLPLLRTATPLLPSPIRHRGCLLSSYATPFCLEDYLVAACGLAPEQARKTAQKAFDEAPRWSRKDSFENPYMSRLHSASNPDAVLALLSGVGLSRDSIAAVVSADPLLLCSSAEKIGPRLTDLRDRLGLSTPQIVRFLLVGSYALRKCDVVPRLEFFISLYGSFEELIWTLKKSDRVLLSDLETVLKPNIALFRQEGGLSVRDIAQLCSRWPWLLSYNPERVKELMPRAKELGVHGSSRMFCQAVGVAAHNTKEKVAARLDFLKSTLGCYESDVATAVSKMPSILGISEDCLRRKIEFLINEVRLEPRYIVQRPLLCTLSLEKRMIPRYCVMKVLMAKGFSSNIKFYSLLALGEKTFKLRYIDHHKDSVPELADVYAKARAGIVPTGV